MAPAIEVWGCILLLSFHPSTFPSLPVHPMSSPVPFPLSPFPHPTLPFFSLPSSPPLPLPSHPSPFLLPSLPLPPPCREAVPLNPAREHGGAVSSPASCVLWGRTPAEIQFGSVWP